MRKTVAKFLRKHAPVATNHPNYKRHVRAAKARWNATPRNQRAKLKEELS